MIRSPAMQLQMKARVAVIEELMGVALQVEYRPHTISALMRGNSTQLPDQTRWQPRWSFRKDLSAQVDWRWWLG